MGVITAFSDKKATVGAEMSFQIQPLHESRERSPLTTRHHVELSVVSPASSDGHPQRAPKVMDLNVTTLPEAKKELERSDAGRQNTPNPVP